MTAVTGFPGSGKTTLINRILHEAHGRKTAAMRPERPWRADEVKQTEWVVIGRELDRDELAEGLAGCAAGVP